MFKRRNKESVREEKIEDIKEKGQEIEKMKKEMKPDKEFFTQSQRIFLLVFQW